MFWTHLLTALALLLVMEGLLPFMQPDRYKQLLAQIVRLKDNQLRMFGFASMASGLVLLLLVRG